MCPLKNLALLNVEIITDSSSQDTASSTTSELDKYLNDSLIGYKTGYPYNWWGQHHKEFPALSILAKHLLNAPATLVPSERLSTIIGMDWTTGLPLKSRT